MPERDDMRPLDSGVKLTYDDFLLLPDDGNRHELIDGEHYVTPAPNIAHQRISGRLSMLIGAWLDRHPAGELFFAPLAVRLSLFDVVEPDLLYVSNERAAALLAGEHVTGAPDLLVEILSPGTRKNDETIKRRMYERFGVTEYWIVDPEREVVTVHTRSGDRFSAGRTPSRAAGNVLKTAILPGLEIPLSRVFAARKQ